MFEKLWQIQALLCCGNSMKFCFDVMICLPNRYCQATVDMDLERERVKTECH